MQAVPGTPEAHIDLTYLNKKRGTADALKKSQDYEPHEEFPGTHFTFQLSENGYKKARLIPVVYA